MAEKVAQEEAKITQIIESRDVERQRRKSVEDRMAQMEAVLASHGVTLKGQGWNAFRFENP